MLLGKMIKQYYKMRIIRLKRLSLLFAFIISVVLACNNGNSNRNIQTTQTASSSDTASIMFNEYEHDFGKIVEGEKVGCVFTFTNVGSSPLVISSAVTSCGCTVPKYDNKPVPPGGSGTLEVVFDSSGRSGLQTKTVTVRSNATKPLVLLKITGEVINNSNN